MKKLFMLLVMQLLFISNVYAWKDGFLYRRCFDLVELSNTTLTNYIYKLILDTYALVPGKLKPDCSDLIITDTNDTTISRFVVNCGTSNTYVYFKINISALGRNKYCIYYGNPSHAEVNDGKIFINFEDFEYITNLNWTIYGCSISDTTSYTGYYSILCNKNRYIEAYLSGNELNFAVKGSYKVGATTYTSTTWQLFTASFSPGITRFTATTDNSYLDTVFTRYVVSPEPKTYFHIEESMGVYSVKVESYCLGDYVVNEVINCRGPSCEVHKNATYCYYGCYAGRCNESPFERSGKLVIIAIGLLTLFYVVWRITR